MILSVASQKGGTGKTTTSLSLATGLARMGKKVLLIDVDSQANASKVLLPDYMSLKKSQTVYATILEREDLQIHKTHLETLDIVPSHILLSNTDVELTVAKDHRESRLKNALEKIIDDYDEVIIDCPPALGWLTINAFTASDEILIVIGPGYFELDSLVQIQKTMVEVKDYYNDDLGLAGFLFTMSDTTVNSRTSLKILRQTYTGDVLNTVIPRNTDLRDAHFDKKDIYEYNSNSTGANAYKKLIKELYKYDEEIK